MKFIEFSWTFLNKTNVGISLKYSSFLKMFKDMQKITRNDYFDEYSELFGHSESFGTGMLYVKTSHRCPK